MLKKAHGSSLGLSGFILLDKPAGITSRQAVGRVERILGSERSGHTGTLDLNVTGLLVIALGEARKTLPLLMNLDKEYEGELHLHADVPDERLAAAFRSFTGKITQLPPVRSRVARKPRVREIYSLSLLGRTGRDNRDVRFRVHCQHGTYIRKLAHDIGEFLGCGAHMTRLRRTGVDGFSLKEAKPLEKISERDVIPIERALDRVRIKKVWIKEKESVLKKVLNGNPLYSFMIRRHDEVSGGEGVGIFSGKGGKQRLVAIGIALLGSVEWVNKKKRPLVKTDRILKH